jgi:hypothetical protein
MKMAYSQNQQPVGTTIDLLQHINNFEPPHEKNSETVHGNTLDEQLAHILHNAPLRVVNIIVQGNEKTRADFIKRHFNRAKYARSASEITAVLELAVKNLESHKIFSDLHVSIDAHSTHDPEYLLTRLLHLHTLALIFTRQTRAFIATVPQTIIMHISLK